MKKRLLFLVIFSFLFFSCGVNNLNDASVCVSLSENTVKKLCREVGASSENLSVECVLKQDGFDDIIKTSAVIDNKAQIEFSNIPIDSEIKIFATVNFNKALNNKYIEKYEGSSEKYTVVDGENKVSIKLSPVYKEGDASISIQENKNEILINAYYITSDEVKNTLKDESELKINDFQKILIEAKLRKETLNEGEKIIFIFNGIDFEADEDGKLVILKQNEFPLRPTNYVVAKLVDEKENVICSKSFSFKLFE